MGYGRLWVKRGMGYKGFDCTVPSDTAPGLMPRARCLVLALCRVWALGNGVIKVDLSPRWRHLPDVEYGISLKRAASWVVGNRVLPP